MMLFMFSLNNILINRTAGMAYSCPFPDSFRNMHKKYFQFLSLHCLMLLLGITTLKIYCDQKDNKYNVDEDITITAEFGNPSAVKYVKWQKNETTTFRTIATTLSRYIGTRYKNFKHMMIRNCCDLDTGSYFLLVTCINDVDITNSIDIQVVRGELHF